MKPRSLFLALVLPSIGAPHAIAQGPLTGAQVKAEYEQAVRAGEVLAPGELGLPLNQLYPHRYPRHAQPPAGCDNAWPAAAAPDGEPVTRDSPRPPDGSRGRWVFDASRTTLTLRY